MLKKLRTAKLETAVAIRDWSDFFSHVYLMKRFIDLLHIYDIVNLHQTCRRLYSFYQGTRFAKEIIVMAARDCESVYKMSPLKFLSGRFNRKLTQPGDLLVKRFTSCYSCKSQINITKVVPLSSTLCTRCIHYSRLFYRTISPKVTACYKRYYREDQWPRIERVMGRLAVIVGQDKIIKLGSTELNVAHVKACIFTLDLQLNDGYAIRIIDGALDVVEVKVAARPAKRLKVVVGDD